MKDNIPASSGVRIFNDAVAMLSKWWLSFRCEWGKGDVEESSGLRKRKATG
jgi:hypothetical protein